ncbi:DUF3606 domain-containing protein [Sphingomonas sp. TF3]|jgi:hypothetical protein|uniref:DUF3606 domain-containing protein n=1 Tax=Sphingomonas sp. TF3 TaxID=2495580 RepID=UPI000F8755B8|nr:DUF3606 domain-containing protein [Sphingomonas sp. TF3]RUN75486.1 DUF3606 domain-containing protein [Sphingomonas sp. TF3]
MADDRNVRGPRDAAGVNVDEDYERRYRLDKSGVPDGRLHAALDKAGVRAEAVERALRA